MLIGIPAKKLRPFSRVVEARRRAREAAARLDALTAARQSANKSGTISAFKPKAAKLTKARRQQSAKATRFSKIRTWTNARIWPSCGPSQARAPFAEPKVRSAAATSLRSSSATGCAGLA